MNTSFVTISFILFAIEIDDTERKIRLIGGLRYEEGYIKIFHQGRWELVCNDGWELLHANIACRQLGFKAAKMNYVTKTRNRQFIAALNDKMIFFITNSCSGDEISLEQCLLASLNFSSKCVTKEFASITCLGMELHILVN